MKTICHTNPTLFVKEVVEAINSGYYFHNTNAGSITETNLLQVILFDDPMLKGIPFTRVEEYKYTIVENDRNTFMQCVQNAILSGMTLDINSVDWYITGPKTATFYNLEHPKAQRYEYQELMDLDWEELKTLGRSYDIGGRNRLTICNAILVAQKEEDK